MTKPKALIVEDNADLSFIYQTALDTGGFETEVCSLGTEAMQAIQRFQPELVVLDLHLPEMNGIDVLSQIRMDDDYKHLSVIITSADANMANVLQDVADIVLIKPVSVGQLRNIAQRLIPAAREAAN